MYCIRYANVLQDLFLQINRLIINSRDTEQLDVANVLNICTKLSFLNMTVRVSQFFQREELCHITVNRYFIKDPRSKKRRGP